MKNAEKPLSYAFPNSNEKEARRNLTIQAKEKALKREENPLEVHQAFDTMPFFIGTTAVHGVEPQQIAVNTALAINQQLEQAGLSQRPILIPYLPGHASYGKTTVEVLQDVYRGREHSIYLSEDLGNALSATEFGKAGYQPHWENVAAHQKEVVSKLLDVVDSNMQAIRLDGVSIDSTTGKLVEDDSFRKTFSRKEKEHILEINAGANASAATESGSVVSHSVFPVTLDGLTELVKRHPDVFDYDPALVEAIGSIATALRAQFTTITLPALHTLAQEQWFATSFPDALLTPPLKEKLPSPVITFGQNTQGEKTMTILAHNEQGQLVEETATGIDADKGIIHVNVSGSGLGGDSAKRFALKAATDGYIVAAPRWIVEDVWGIPKDEEKQKALPEDIRTAAKRIVRVGPEILFAKDEKGNNLCQAFFMRPGMGSYAYAQLAEVPMLVIGYADLENPEMWGNTNVISENKIGRRYTGRPDSIEQVKPLQGNIAQYNAQIYKQEGIPEDMDGLEYTARFIIAAEIERQKTQ